MHTKPGFGPRSRRVLFTAALIICGLAVACQPTLSRTLFPSIQPTPSMSTGWPAEPHPNYGFVFEYGACFTHKFDTFRAEFTQDRGPREQSITIPLKLSVEQMRTIYDKMVEIDLPEYPALYEIFVGPGQPAARITPAPRYKLGVVNGNAKVTVSWHDEIVEPTAPEADQLRKLLGMIKAAIEEDASVKNLPQLNFGCA